MTKSKRSQPSIVEKFYKKDGFCNICEQEKDLSMDHVPPKVCPSAKNTVISKLFYQMTNNRAFRPRISQNGITFKTLCNACNNSLGTRYDQCLGDFSRTIESSIESNLILPSSFEMECRPNAIMRSVLGHLLAAKTETDEVIIDKLIRPCILDPSLPIHDDIHIFYWIYPYEKTIIFRDFGMPAVRGQFNKPGFFNMIKFYPIAFLITHQLDEYEGLDSLHDFNHLSASARATISIKLNPVRNSTWPEECGMDNFLIVGSTAKDSIYAIPKSKS